MKMPRDNYQKKRRGYQAEAENLAEESSDEDNLVQGHIDIPNDADGFVCEDYQIHKEKDKELSQPHEHHDYCNSDENIVPERPLSSDDSAAEESHDKDYEGFFFQDEVRSFLVDSCLPRSMSNRLLDILRRQGYRFPKDCRTIMKTPRSVQKMRKCGGDYIYFGLETGILTFLAQNPDYSDCTIRLQLNIDGIPIFKSSSDQFWPILAKFGPYKPFIVALFLGKKKPTPVEDLLEDFLEEYTKLQEQGITFNDRSFQCVIDCFICDAPARSMIKFTKGHTGYNSCERCTIHGEWGSGRVVYHDLRLAEKRKDEEFALQHYVNHQYGISPLTKYNISCIEKFPLDYMHLVCLGVVRRMLYFLKKGPRICKLSQTQLSEISRSLEDFRGRLPSEFARQPRGLEELDRWKATELRQFLLYTGIVVLKPRLHKRVYNHFLLLSMAVSILLSDDETKRTTYLQYARNLLEKFVRDARAIYGDTFTVYNVHGLLHLTDDVDHFHCSLNDISAFPFENFLQDIKKLVKNGHNPLVQVAKRLAEQQGGSSGLVTSKSPTVSTKPKDACFMLENGDFAIVRDKEDDEMYRCDIYKHIHLDNFFDLPCKSKLFNIAFSKFNEPSHSQCLRRQQLTKKAVALPYKTGCVLIPVLNSQQVCTCIIYVGITNSYGEWLLSVTP